MSLVIICGLDRTGKTTVAEHYKLKGFELVHQSAPLKGMTADAYLEEQIQLIASAALKDVVLDRSYYGECCIWPFIYGRDSLLSEENLEILKELEVSVDTTKILMIDPNIEAHWKRCVDNNEPLTKPQFIQARTLFSKLADKHGFARQSLHTHYPELMTTTTTTTTVVDKQNVLPVADTTSKLTKEQVKLETANAINDIMSKRILKSKGQIYDQLEDSLRAYLNNELGKIFGTKTEVVDEGKFSNEEFELLKFFCKKLKEKQ